MSSEDKGNPNAIYYTRYLESDIFIAKRDIEKIYSKYFCDITMTIIFPLFSSKHRPIYHVK